MDEFPPALLNAVAFAARAHAGQLRKDGRTPYVSHVMRVCLIVRHLFGVDDPAVLTAALLHDTIEDTTTDYDDVEDHFGAEVAGWVAALSKEKRLREDQREAAYCRVLAQAPWQVRICKLADVYDNLSDLHTQPSEKRQRSLDRSELYLDALRTDLPPRLERPLALVERLWQRLRASDRK